MWFHLVSTTPTAPEAEVSPCPVLNLSGCSQSNGKTTVGCPSAGSDDEEANPQYFGVNSLHEFMAVLKSAEDCSGVVAINSMHNFECFVRGNSSAAAHEPTATALWIVAAPVRVLVSLVSQQHGTFPESPIVVDDVDRLSSDDDEEMAVSFAETTAEDNESEIPVDIVSLTRRILLGDKTIIVCAIDSSDFLAHRSRLLWKCRTALIKSPWSAFRSMVADAAREWSTL
jgi:hypothetical protein